MISNYAFAETQPFDVSTAEEQIEYSFFLNSLLNCMIDNLKQL